MKEIQDILRAYAAARTANLTCALATVVRVSGSTYRRPGARVLVTANGDATGCVSGGCLEKEVIQQAQLVLKSGEPRVITFDTLAEEEIVFGYGMGCRGFVTVLIEGLDDKAAQMSFFASCIQHRRDGVFATVFAVEGSGARLGDRLMMQEGGQTLSNIMDDSLRGAVASGARAVLHGASQTIVYELPGGQAHVFIERIDPPIALVVFGAGHDSVPLARLAMELGWCVTLVDYRPDNVARAQRSGVHSVIVARPEEFGEKIKLVERDAVIVMNHNYLDDLAVLEAVLKDPPCYLGVLGPRVRTERMLLDIRKRATSWPDGAIDKLYAPVGLDIGADNPEEIALAIIAEIKAVTAGRSGEHLRDRGGPLHERACEDLAMITPSHRGDVGCCNATFPPD